LCAPESLHSPEREEDEQRSGARSHDDAADALASTANFLKGHGWRPGASYQPGETNFRAIQAWNAAPVYQRAIALIGRQIDEGVSPSARR
jgi:membrane-bound lytic murein transglycosylase B